jgi:hypothetical protein
MDRTNAERQRRYIARLKSRAAPDARVQELEKENAQLRARIHELENGAARSTAKAKHDRTTLRQLGIDPHGLSAADIAKGARLAARLFRDDCCSPGPKTDKEKAAAELQAWAERTGAVRKASRPTVT